jgi:hypothetical protein
MLRCSGPEKAEAQIAGVNLGVKFPAWREFGCEISRQRVQAVDSRRRKIKGVACGEVREWTKRHAWRASLLSRNLGHFRLFVGDFWWDSPPNPQVNLSHFSTASSSKFFDAPRGFRLPAIDAGGGGAVCSGPGARRSNRGTRAPGARPQTPLDTL